MFTVGYFETSGCQSKNATQIQRNRGVYVYTKILELKYNV